MKNTLQEKFFLFQIRARRNPEAFARIYDTYATTIYRFIAYKVSSKEIAEDLLSETFLKTWQYLTDGSKRVESVQALLYTVARHVVIDHYRVRAKTMGDVTLDESFLMDDEQDVLATDTSIQGDIDDSIDLEKVSEGLQMIRQGYRDVIVMKYLDQLSTSEIARVLGKTNAQVRVLLHRALSALKETLHSSQHAPIKTDNSADQSREERSREAVVAHAAAGQSRENAS